MMIPSLTGNIPGKADAGLQEKIEWLERCANELPTVIIVMELATETVVYMSDRGRAWLGGVSQEALTAMGADYLRTYFNPEDVADYLPKILDMVYSPDHDKIVTFFQQVRASEQDPWSWYISTSKVFMRDAAGNPTHVITNATPIDPLHHITSKVNRLLEENNFLRLHKEAFALLTKREKEILHLMALGLNSSEMAAKLHISEKTATTHRRNIRIKLNAPTHYEITRFAQAFDLI
ncbi:helix-turn-helix transcriptional regulator [Chitinophaga defluvii]|uniref:Helix-turn-helix transcriptional regulator n=1 Tax=Chitinophaga defluvii TaxID=3163343 RepID=A0ABV2T3S4_9BACT